MSAGDIVEVYGMPWRLILYCFTDDNKQVWLAVQEDSICPCEPKVISIEIG